MSGCGCFGGGLVACLLGVVVVFAVVVCLVYVLFGWVGRCLGLFGICDCVVWHVMLGDYVTAYV